MTSNIYPFIIVLKLLYKGVINFKGIIFLFFTILTLSSLMLLKNYQVFFEDYYISYLKSIYPHNFSTMKKVKDIDIKGITYKDEIYEVALEDIGLFLHKDNHYKKAYIKSLGIRSFDKNNIVEIIQNIYQEDTIFISQKLYEKIVSNKDFYGKISLDNPNYKFKIKPFKTHLEDDYVLIDSLIAKKLFSPSRFNIVNIYSNYDDVHIQNIFKKHNIRITNWKDRLPFFNKLFFGIYKEIFFIYTVLFSMLIMIFMVFFLSSLIDDMKEALRKILYFGNSFLYTFFIFFFVLSLFALFVFYISYPIFYFTNYFIINYILMDFNINGIIDFNIEIFYTISLIATFSFIWTLNNKINFIQDEI